MFGSPWMLVWLPMVAAPILIHLWNRRRYREMSWAAMEYLLAAMVKSSRRMRIEQLLLLAVRTLIILLIVFALARPLMDALGSHLTGESRTHHVLVIDVSYSMAYKPAEESFFEKAKGRAIELIQASGSGDGFSLILMGEFPRAVISTASRDREEVIEEVKNLRLLHGGAKLATTVQKIEEVVLQMQDDDARYDRYHVSILTDLGRNTWDAANRSEAVDKELQQRLARLRQGGAIEVVSLSSPVVSNLAITDLQVRESYATTAQPVTLTALVQNYALTPQPQRQIELFVDGHRVDQQTVDIPAGELATPVVFSYRFATSGDHRVEVRLQGDSLHIDNRRYLVLQVKQQLTALCVSGKQSSTKFLAAALGADAPQETQAMIRSHVVPESSLLELNLANYDCIFLCNVGQFTTREAAVLEAYLKQGGGLVFFLGDQVQPDRYNRELSKASGAVHDVLPVVLGEAVQNEDESNHRFDPLDYSHPLVRIWQGNEDTGLLTTPVLKYIRLMIPETDSQASDSDTQVALAFENGDPAIVQGEVHQGRSLVVATAASTSSTTEGASGLRSWTLMPTWPTFPVIVQQLWKAAVGGSLEERNVGVFQALGGGLEGVWSDDRIVVHYPENQISSQEEARGVSLAPTAEADRWSFEETDTSGFYRVTAGDEATEMLFAVNVDTQESDPSRVKLDELPEGFTAMDNETLSGGRSTGSMASIHMTLLMVVLGLLFTETALAWWLGNRQI